MVGCARPKDCHYVTINVKNQSQLRWQSIDARVIFQIFFININGRRWDEARIDLQFSLMLSTMKASSRVASGVKNLWATNFSGPKKAMHFWKVHYLALISWGGVYRNAWA